MNDLSGTELSEGPQILIQTDNSAFLDFKNTKIKDLEKTNKILTKAIKENMLKHSQKITALEEYIQTLRLRNVLLNTRCEKLTAKLDEATRETPRCSIS